ncbi:EpsG family protein [Paenibacillus sp. CGMCC 1.16610]|uniref:EpsG family protein n=1 Tax=Paenibacillus anseongense TaxID=2682845 RepID=A0ABW9U6A0_9BACL|nr:MULTISPECIES: EpsG family protein [Paenibacillus]MBA2943352.1 EpsG family protein [Paenibacillus sp. CGMCC 1.16610]MVQ33850.1 EpsG family protein [Paenibacillus anseongense]
MAILWVNLIVVYIASYFSRILAKPVAIGAEALAVKPNKWLAGIVMATFVVIAGLRNNIGDTFFYMYSYRLNNYTWEQVKAEKDIGFGILQMILQKITDDPQLLIFITALVTNVLIVYVLYKYSRMFELSIFIYITSGLFLVSMSGVRQFLASAIIFAATKYLFEGNWKKYFLVVSFASLFHGSALILIPMFFVVRRKAWTSSTFVILILAMLLILGYSVLSDAIFSAIADTHYSEYQNFQEGGANIIRVAISAIPLIFAFIGRHKLSEIFPYSDYVVNMSIINFVVMAVATQNWIFARFTIYFGVYNVILISYVISLFVKREQKLMYYMLLGFYLIYFYYENVVSLNIIYRSDYLKF